MADAKSELARSTIECCLYCHEAELTEGFDEVEDFFFRNVGGQFNYRRCDQCGSLVLTNPLGSEVLHEAYSEYYTHGTPTSSSSDGLKGFLKKHYLQRRFGQNSGLISQAFSSVYQGLATDFDTIDRIGRYAPSAPALILDYGCGDGEFLVQMRDFGHSVTGVDFDPVCVRSGAEKGISVCTPSEVPAEDWIEQFDFVSLAHVVEHVPDPATLLSKLTAWLKPGGTFFLETPNADAFGLEVFGKYWRGLEAPRHLSLPSLSGIIEAAEAAGLALQRQVVSQSLRTHLWQECLTVVPESDQQLCLQRMAAADPLTNENAEFITLILTKNV